MNQDFNVQKKKAVFVWKKFVQRDSPEKKIPAQALSEKKKIRACWKFPTPPPHHFSNGPSLITISVYIWNNLHPSLYTSNDVKFPSLVVRSSANSGYKGILSIGDYSSYSSFVTR